MTIRQETVRDVAAIARVERAAFERDPHRPAGTDPTEYRIVDTLREAGALTVSLVAEDAGEILGHVACSPVQIDGRPGRWYGLGPVGVRPDRQGQGIGSALVRGAIARLRSARAAGVVLVGDPGFYGRFGFRAEARLIFDGVPAEYFLCLPLEGAVPAGTVTYHEAFSLP
jgi:putative acetyltransferase